MISNLPRQTKVLSSIFFEFFSIAIMSQTNKCLAINYSAAGDLNPYLLPTQGIDI